MRTIQAKCAYCENRYVAQRKSSKYCSTACRTAANREHNSNIRQLAREAMIAVLEGAQFEFLTDEYGDNLGSEILKEVRATTHKLRD
jgi:hypothetical protein